MVGKGVVIQNMGLQDDVRSSANESLVKTIHVTQAKRLQCQLLRRMLELARMRLALVEALGKHTSALSLFSKASWVICSGVCICNLNDLSFSVSNNLVGQRHHGLFSKKVVPDEQLPMNVKTVCIGNMPHKLPLGHPVRHL